MSLECELYNDRKILALNNTPQTRITTVSPYPKYTSFQLDMRRKVEILKYQNVTSNSKTNNFSKKQQWSMLVNGVTKNASQATINGTAVTECLLDDLIPTLSSSCDVPGKSIILQYDPSIPLYNYKPLV
jgi:hypothetical protein